MVVAGTTDRRIRTLDHSRDIEEVKLICADVYGGHDYLPHELQRYSKDQHKTVLVSEDGDGRLQGLICVEERLDMAWVFGLRVHPRLQGRGIGSSLMAAAEQHARTLPEALTMQTATIVQQLAVQKMLSRLGWTLHQALDMWPESQETVKAAQLAKDGGAGAGSIISFVHGAAAAVSTAEATALLPAWQVCQSAAELAVAVEEVQQQLQPSPAEFASRAARVWLPFHYEPQPVENHEVTDAIAAGRVYILPREARADRDRASCANGTTDSTCASSSSSCQPADDRQNGSNSSRHAGDLNGSMCSSDSSNRCRGVVIVQSNLESSSPSYTHSIAGIMGVTAAAVGSGLLLAELLEPHFVAFVARPVQEEPALFRATPTACQYCLIYSKDLAG